MLTWTVLVPMKALAGAKSRLSGAAPDRVAHRRLVAAMRADTLAAAAAAQGVARVVAVIDRASGARGLDHRAFVQQTPGLNEGLAEAAANAVEQWPHDAVAALVADLPALRPYELADALVAAAGYERAFVPDAEGTGTTLLTARRGIALEPQFGEGSAARHAAGAMALPGGAGLRRDVDVPDDLAAAHALGVGPLTSRELAARSA